LDKHPKVMKVFYPGLESHPQHDIARQQMNGYGGMLAFMVKGGYDAVKAFLPRLRYAHRAGRRWAFRKA
jgi:cystathionine gamma-synthase